jgi:hypothetical protein
MNSPLNPVMKSRPEALYDRNKSPETGPAPACPANQPKPGPLTGRKVIGRAAPQRLSMPDSYALIEWLKAYVPPPGSSYDSIAVAAAASLGNPAINKAHIEHRMAEFGMKLPAQAEGGPLVERIAKLEALLTSLILNQEELCKRMGVPVAPLLKAHIEQVTGMADS